MGLDYYHASVDTDCLFLSYPCQSHEDAWMVGIYSNLVPVGLLVQEFITLRNTEGLFVCFLFVLVQCHHVCMQVVSI